MKQIFDKESCVKKVVNGYVMVYLPEHSNNVKGWVQEHRIICEEKIGRVLDKKFVIHHIDMNKWNNSINNLMIFPNNKSHISFHKKIEQFGWTQPVLTQIKNRWENYI